MLHPLPPSACPSPARRSGPAIAVLVALLAALLLALPQARAEDLLRVRTPGPKDQYRSLEAAWQGRNAAGVVALVPSRGSLALRLTTPPVAGTYQRAQAQHTLTEYFRGVSEIRLVNRTPRGLRTPRNVNVRYYDYSYLPRGHDRVTTRLTVMMRGDGRGGWTLDSIRESPRPEPR